jgi:hypothetical protein
MGGLSGGDALCQSAASAAGLAGTFFVWLADDTGSPATRFTQSAGPYVQPNGVLIADDWADLIDGSLQNGIVVSETGANLGAGFAVLSNVATDGTLLDAAGDCGNWSSSAGSANAGQSGTTTSSWTVNSSAFPCHSLFRIYCFQQ